MAPVGSRMRAVGAAAIASILIGLHPAPARAADDVVRLPGETAAAVRIDFDGDGVVDLVRLRMAADGPPQIELWIDDADAGWSLAAAATVPWPSDADVDAPNATIGSALLVARVEGVRRPLLVTTLADPGAALPMTCCLTIHTVGRTGDRLLLDAHPVEGASADELIALDFDGDGSDEIAVTSFAAQFDAAEPPTVTTRVLGWRGGVLGVRVARERDGYTLGSAVGDLDGRPGLELITALDEPRRLERLGWDGSELVFVETQAPDAIEGSGWPAGVVDGRVVYVDSAGVSLLAWGADGSLERERLVRSADYPNAAVVGSGDDAIVVVESGSHPFGARARSEVYDARLRPLGNVVLPAGAQAVRELFAEIETVGRGAGRAMSLWAFSGPMPRQGHDMDGWALPGGIVRPDGAGGWVLEPMPPVLGVPLGRLGHDDEWLAVCEACWASEGRTYIMTAPIPDLAGLVLARADAFAASEVAAAAPKYHGAVEIGVEDGMTELLVRPSGATIEVDVPDGGEVVTYTGVTLKDHEPVGGTFRLKVLPDDQPDGERRWRRAVITIGPDLRVRVDQWTGTFATAGGPNVVAMAEAVPLAFEATITGTVEPGSALSVDGQPAAVDARGEFSHVIGAQPWPRVVALTASDPFGTQRTLQLEVVGFVDARELPWVPAVATATLLFGVVLFLRVPREGRARSGRGVTDDEGGTYEDLEDLAPIEDVRLRPG